MADEPKQHELEITEQTFALIRDADAVLAAARDRHQAILAATLAAANIPSAEVASITRRDGKLILLYTVPSPNGGPP